MLLRIILVLHELSEAALHLRLLHRHAHGGGEHLDPQHIRDNLARYRLNLMTCLSFTEYPHDIAEVPW